MNKKSLFFKLYAAILLFFYSNFSFAAVETDGVHDKVLARFKTEAATWLTTIFDHASWLFWLLVVISMIITFGTMALRKADIGEFFAEFIKFTLFTGFFWWLLLSATSSTNSFPVAIIRSLIQIGSDAGGLSGFNSPSKVVDIGFIIFGKALTSIEIMNPIDSLVVVVISLGVLVLCALIGINLLLLLISGWILAYAGVFFLGFGGSRWTSDIAINYYKTVLSLAAQAMAMILLIGIGRSIIFDFSNQLSAGLNITEYAVIFIVTLIIFVLTNKIPPLLGGVINGTSIGSSAQSGFGGGAALAGTAAAGAALATGAAAMSHAATNISGGASAVMEAIKQAQSNMETGSGSFSSSSSESSSGSSDSGSSSLASAMGTGQQQSMGISESSSSPITNTDTTNAAESSSNEISSSGSPSGASEPGSSEPGTSESPSGSSESPSGSKDANTSQSMGFDTSSSNGSENSVSDESPNEPNSEKRSTLGAIKQGATTSAKFAADVGANLMKGMASSASNAVAERVDKAKEAIANTPGGRLAEEIRNPGQAKQARQDIKDIAAADKVQSNMQRSEQAEAARSFLSGNNQIDNSVNKDS